MLFRLLWLAAVTVVASAVALHPRQTQSTVPSVDQGCPVTVASYMTVTVTHIPPTVTIVVPDYGSIATSIESVSEIDSIVVVEQSQDRPVSAPINTAVPTFVHTIVAPAFEATEVPTGSNPTVYYVSVSNNGTGQAPTSNVILGITTLSILPQTIDSTQPDPTTTIRSTILLTSTVRGPFTSAMAGWNGTSTNSTAVGALGSISLSSQTPAVSTVTTYVATETVVVSTFITPQPMATDESGNVYGYSNQPEVEKRQTCVLVSAAFAGVWGTWCNNWDGHTIMSYTSWATTITPGVTPADSTTDVSGIPAQTSASIPSIQSASATTSTATSVPGCGEVGPFSITFDNLPAQSASEDSAGLPPIFNPYDHLYWSESWSYVPPPSDPYPPQSGAQLGISSPLTQDLPNNTISGIQIPVGGFGAGPRDHIDAYWFNAHWAYVGCQANISDASGVCDFVAQGYRFDEASGQSLTHVIQHFSQPLCESEQCQLQRIDFNDMFNALTTLSFYARIGDQLRVLYVDSMGLGWWNNTCEAGMLRSSSRK